MPNSGSKILYIDDDIGLCRLAQRRLERLGFNVTLAHGGPEGLALAAESRFDLIALDHYMPGQDGIETLGQIMALPVPPAVVYVTGSDETHIAVAALKAGASDYVVKSASEDFYDLLGRTINQALDARRLVAEKERSEQKLRETNAQLEAMLSEMNHRVANSLQMVSALVNMRARSVAGDEAKEIVRDIRERIDAVARVHRQLYGSGGGTTIAMAEYIAGLAYDLAQTYSTEVSRRDIVAQSDAILLPAGTAITLGVLISELVCNACKYAYAEGESGAVRIVFRQDGDNSCSLTVEDDGVGLVADSAPQGTGLGMQIIRAMASSLGASLTHTNTGSGLRVEIGGIEM